MRNCSNQLFQNLMLFKTKTIHHFTTNQTPLFMRKQFFVFALAVVSLVSCKKEPVNNNGSNNGGGGTDPDPIPTAKVLKKITSTTEGQSKVLNLTYNSSKQLLSIKSTDNSDVTNFVYDGDGNVIKMESADAETRSIFEYVYENGIPARGTFKMYERNGGEESLIEDDVIHYTVEGGKVTHINMDMNVQQQEVNFALTYNSNGNLTKIQGENGLDYTATFTYGNKKPMFPQAFKFILDHAGYTVHFFAKNDLLSQGFDFAGTEHDFENTVQNTYDANGYVLTSNDGDTQLSFEYQ
jgi:YD repeat-containing protein